MSERYNLFKKVDLNGAEAINFIGYVGTFEHSAFKVLDASGKDMGYVCEFAPNTLRHLRIFPCVRKEYVDAEQREGTILNVPMGLCTNIRIVANLLCLAYPHGVMQQCADFDNISRAIKERKTIQLMNEEDAKQVVSYAPFNSNWLEAKLAETSVRDTTPPNELIP